MGNCNSGKSYPGDIEADSLIQEQPPPPDYGHASRSVDPCAECHGCFRNGHCCLGLCSCLCLGIVLLFVRSLQPLSEPPADFGGPETPPVVVQLAEQPYETDLKPAENIEKTPGGMLYGKGQGDQIPLGLAGIWWLDTGGASTIAKDPQNNYSFAQSPDLLQSFGGLGAPAAYDKTSQCLTVLNYGGSTAFRGGEDGIEQFKDYRERKLTTSYCFAGQFQDLIEVYVKEVPGGPMPNFAKIKGAYDAGNGYEWKSPGEVRTQMVKTRWGWQVITISWRGFDPLELIPIGYFPMLQIVDGTGTRTNFYAEYLQSVGGATGQVVLPRPVTLPVATTAVPAETFEA